VQGDRTERLAKLKKKAPRGRPKVRLMDLNELAEYLHVSRRTIYRLIDRNLPHTRVGYVLRFDLARVLAWLQDFTDRGDQLHWSEDYDTIKRTDRRSTRPTQTTEPIA
jgi:excisionase family DNA binding protein